MKNENRLLLMIFITCMAMAVWSITSMVNADQMVHKFKSPSFSGIGTSAHYLTIENQEKTRKDAIKEKRAADEEKRLAALKNTNYAKFIKNLESRIYARFSKEMEDALFGESCGTTWPSGTATAPTAGQTNNEPPTGGNTDGYSDCTGEMTFNGTYIKFTKDVSADEVILEIDGPDGSTKITLPLNDFQF